MGRLTLRSGNKVLYDKSPNPKPGHKYRQMVVLDDEDGRGYELRIREGDVILTEPFTVESRKDWAEFHLFDDFATSLAELDKEYNDSIENGWHQYDPLMP